MFPTLFSKPNFNDSEAETIARSFKEAMKGFGTDEQRVIKEITSLTNQQRQVVKEKYLAMFGHSLEQDLKSELKGDFEDIVVALLLPRYEYEAQCVRKAIHGLGTRESVLVELICTKESAEIEQLKQTFKRLYNKDLEHELESEERGALGRVFRAIATGDRPTGNKVDNELAQQEAQEIYNAGEGKLGTDENEFVRVLVSRSFAQLKATFEEYEKIAGKSLEDAIKAETVGNLRDALVAIVRSIKSRPAYYAKQLRKCMALPGTKEDDITRILVTRCEIDMGAIKNEYFNLFQRSLYDDLKKELRGDFEEIVLKLVGN